MINFDTLLVCNIMFRGSQQILPNRFCTLSIKQLPPSPSPWPALFLTEYQTGKYTSHRKTFKIQLPFLLLWVILHQLSHQKIWCFTNFLELHSGLIEKIFLTQIFLCWQTHSNPPTPPPPLPPLTAKIRWALKVFYLYSLMGEASFLQALMTPEYWETLT